MFSLPLNFCFLKNCSVEENVEEQKTKIMKQQLRKTIVQPSAKGSSECLINKWMNV